VDAALGTKFAVFLFWVLFLALLDRGSSHQRDARTAGFLVFRGLVGSLMIRMSKTGIFHNET
jgi:hypothetical protein